MDRVTIDLPQDLADLLRSAVETGGYASQSDVVAEALRVWDEERYHSPEAVIRLRALVQEGLASGPAQPLDLARIKQKARDGFRRPGA